MRWVGLAVVLLCARVASAGTITINGTMTPTTVNVGAANVGTTGVDSSFTLADSDPSERVDLVIGTCTGAGAGTFTLDATTNVNPPATIAVNYDATARGARSCTVTVYATGTTMPALGTFTLSATGVAPVVDVRVGTTSITTHAFGSVRSSEMATTSTLSQVFTVANTSTDAGQVLTVSGFMFGGTNPSDFTVTAGSMFPVNINPGATATWTVTFNPGDNGARSAVMSVLTNDPITASRDVNVSGTGTTAVIGVSDVAFDTVPAGTGGTLNSVLSNSASTNQGVLTATSATIAQSSTWFSFGAGLGCTAGTTACSLTGATAPANKNIPIRCIPPADASGTETAVLTVTSDTDAGGDNMAAISCTAGRPNIMLDKTSLDFGAQFVATAATAQTVTVTNNGNTTLNFYFARGGTNPAQFSASTMSGCGVSSLNQCMVAPTTSMVINVGFTPTTAGAKSATLVITNNDPDAGDSPQTVTLAGVGIAPIAAADPTALAFGDVEVGKTGGPMTLHIRNTGTANLTISNAALTGADFAVATGTTGTQTTVVAPNASAMWTLTCTPGSQGDKTGTFAVTSNSNGVAGTVTNVGLTCRGTRGFLTITPASHNFGGVRAGDTASHNFVLTNSGNLTVSNITYVLDVSLVGFTVTNAPTTLGPGASQQFTVTFAPAAATDGCVVVNAGDCGIVFSGDWGTTPTKTMATVVVTGDGLNATYDTTPAAPNALEFGEVRWDGTKVMQVSVINTGGSPLKIEELVITPGGTTVAGELAVQSCQRGATIIPCPISASAADDWSSSTANDTLTLNIVCNPADRVGMIEGTLTVRSDLNTAMPDRTVPLRCVSTTAALSLNPSNMVLDFGATDLDAVPVAVTRRITLMNTGNAPLNVGAGTRGGAALARFAFTATNAVTVMPGTGFDVDVTYTPLVEKPPNAPDTASVTFPLVGWHNGPTSMTINITGYGADRHIGVGAAPTFPDTFKNPGDAAPVMPVTISNTGHAPLNITAVMLDNDPIWTIDNPDPVTIPATSTYDFNVRFQPLMAGKAPTGRLLIMNNDNGNALVQVDLNGNGRDRNVAMGPRVIPLGFTGIGIPIRLSDLTPDEPLLVENADTENAFRIATIQVDSITGADGTFEIVDLNGNDPSDLPLDPGGSQAFDITFTPTEVGDFEAVATLYLDQDPSPQAQVTLRGRGLYVDARGGGGCSTSQGSRGWLAMLLVAIVVGLRRRRLGAAAAAAVLAVPAGAAAQSAVERNLNLNVFEPTPATVGGTFQLQPADVGANGDWVASALLTYANNALILDTSQNDDAAVKNRTMLLIGGAYAFGERFEAGIRVPLLLQSGDPVGDPTMRFGIDPASGASLGDATLHGKVHLGASEALGGDLAYGFGAGLTVPTASSEDFAGSDLPTGRLLFLATLSHKRLTTTINVGGVARQSTRFANLDYGSGGVWGAGMSFRLLDKLWIGGEVFGELIPGGKIGEPTSSGMMGEPELLNTIEGIGGLHLRPTRTTALGIAAGRGVTSGPGTPALRALFTFTYAPGTDELRPIHPPRPKEPPKDTDVDGVVDSLDECPADVEDADGFEDADGCPDPDNDKDGFADAADKCPGEAEDRDRFEDEDGCPDRDNDGDAIADAKDKCPLAAEDKDGFQDADGCPEADNDGDGIVDTVDKCPKEPESINGNDDDDGCPDKGNSLVVLSPDRIELLESVQFSSGAKIAKSSQNVLGQIGATLRAHPEIVRVRLTAHVQPTRNAKADLKLSEARAKAVREWLVDWGIEPLRLQSSGFGGGKPLVDPSTRGAREINDRFELIILERK